AYRVVAGSALVSGDPVGEEDEFPELLANFRRMAHAHGWRIAVLGASAERLPLYRALGLRTVKLGDEAVVHPATFSLEGRKIRKVRQSVHRLGKAGYKVRVLKAREMDAGLRAGVRDLAAEARGRWPDHAFQLERLLRFSGKFFPEWRPRFLCIERLSDFPAVGIAYLRAESLLTPPGPWVRARTPV